ncbi:MAG: hypothetical protein LBU43_04700 [Candidatus Accumulibacter sp.]|jgi:hypothetical protein|nr:hypothetical protein [Accumulibacter sp.]
MDTLTDKIAAKKALCILLYALGKGPFRMLGKILEIDHTQVYRWVRAFGESLAEPEVSGEISEMEFDEMWQRVGIGQTSIFLRAFYVASRTFGQAGDWSCQPVFCGWFSTTFAAVAMWSEETTI